MGESKRRKEFRAITGMTPEQAHGILRKRRSLKNSWQAHLENIPGETPPHVVEAFRVHFYMGAATLFDLVMACLDSGKDATPEDLKFMDALNQEINTFADEMAAKVKKRG